MSKDIEKDAESLKVKSEQYEALRKQAIEESKDNLGATKKEPETKAIESTQVEKLIVNEASRAEPVSPNISKTPSADSQAQSPF